MAEQKNKKLEKLFQLMQQRERMQKQENGVETTQKVGATTTSSKQTIGLADRRKALPLSFSQQRLWFMEQLDPDAGLAYHIMGGLCLEGGLDREAMGRALDEIVARHEVLRTHFQLVNDEPVQAILSADCGFPLEDIDISDGVDSDAVLCTLAEKQRCKPFDLASGRLIRGQMIRLGEQFHVLYLCIHHAVFDGWSMGILLQELSTLYNAFCQRRPNPLPALAVQYADYAVWQREQLHGDRLNRQVEYWKKTLAGAPPLMGLPTDFPRPLKQDYRGGRLPVRFNAVLTAGIKALSQRHGLTNYMTLLAIWSMLMSRLSGQDDVVIGSPIANRTLRETEYVIGFFANTIALRVDVSGSLSAKDFFARFKQQNIAAQSHQDVPFDQVVEQVQPQRSLAYTPIFQVMFAWQNASEGILDFTGLNVKGLDLDMTETAAQFDLSLSLGESGDVIEGDIRYAKSLFTQETIARYLGYWQRLVQGLVDEDCNAIDTIEILDETERTHVVHGFNASQVNFPAMDCIHERFEQQAAANPDAVAVVYEDAFLTYGELNRQANQLAHWLREQGVRPDSRVAIALPRSSELMVAILATLKAGGAYVPLDPDTPEERLSYILQDSTPNVLISSQKMLSRLDQLSMDSCTCVLLFDGIDQSWRQLSMENLGRRGFVCHESGERPASDDKQEQDELTNRHMAYIIYTSGSTGKPKGVMVEHYQVIRLLAATQADYQFSHQDVWTLFHSYAFDFSVWEMWGALLLGGRLVIVPQLISRSPTAFYQLVCDQQVTVLNQTPSAFRQLIAAQCDQSIPHQLRYVIFGGEALELPALEPWYRNPINTQTQLVNMYGITETTVHCTFHALKAADVSRAGPSPIGRPLADLRLYILDEHRQPVPVGVTGELYIGGSGVARGYFNRPQLTAERFLPDPFLNPILSAPLSQEDPDQEHAAQMARMYKSGDLGRWLADGTIEYLGRNDDQVKIRGFRIELGEITAVLQQCPEVIDALVVALDSASGAQYLVAYYIPNRPDETVSAPAPASASTIEALKAQLNAQLPYYMVPAAYVAITQMPLTANGKVDRKALPLPDDAAFARQTYAAPQGEIEQTLAEIWQSLLHVEQVGRHDGFFELGGHSLLAVQMTSRVRAALDRELSLATLFAHSNLCDVARILSDSTQTVHLPEITPIAMGNNPPLSLAQQRIWFVSEMDDAATEAYTITGGVHLQGRLNVLALQRALDRIMVRHASLRTRIETIQGVPNQVVRAAHGNSFPLIITAMSDTPFKPRFDLAKGRLVQGQLVQISGQEHVLWIAMHHIISDGWSMGRFMEELTTLYTAFSQRQRDPLPPLTIQYGDYAAWQHAHIQGEILQTQQAYWHAQLQGAPELLTLPTDRPRPKVQQFTGKNTPVILDSELTAGLRALSQRHGCTLFMTLLASWSVLMSRLSNQDNVVIGTPVAGRTRAEVEPLIGMFVNTQALRVDLSGDPDTAALLAQVKETALAAQAHQDIPFEQVVESVSPERSLGYSPIFQVMFAMQNLPEATFELPGLTLSPVQSEVTTAQFDLSLMIRESEGNLIGDLNYATALFDEATVQRYLGYWQHLLHGMITQQEQPVASLPLLGDVEYDQVIHAFNATQTDYPQHTCLHPLFERYAQSTPDAIAVVYGSQQLSYEELNQRANQLAHALRAQGVCLGCRVAIALERRIELVVAILATLKAGGVYVPLDPNYPADRIEHMLTDSLPTVLITVQDSLAQLTMLPDDLPRICLDDIPPVRALPMTDESVCSSLLSDNLAVSDLGLQPHDLAYIIYTSGSTGKPKGVMVTHQNVVKLVVDNGYADFQPTDRVACVSNPAFDAMTMELWGALANGGQLVILNNEDVLDAVRLKQLLEYHEVNIMFMTVALFNQSVNALQPYLARMRYLLIGGEEINPEFVRQLLRDNPPQNFLNGYGPTETTTFAICCRMNDIDPEVTSIPIGRPIGNTKAYLLNAYQQPVPIGVVGEIYLGGAGVARGYLNQSDLTAERFLSDPFSPDPQARMYRTGDLGYWRSDGTIEFVGRNDFQVKIRGFRIELGEIESALLGCEGVQSAVVLALGHTSEDKQLVAYFTQAPDVTLTVADLKATLSEVLPTYMVPAAYVALDHLPLTANGKMDRKALPKPDDAAYVRGEVYEAPEGDIEERLAKIWQSLLGVVQVGRHDHFFELGGHSLLAVQFISRIRQEFSVEMTVSTLFEYPRLKALAERLVYLKLSAFKMSDLESLASQLFRGK